MPKHRGFGRPPASAIPNECEEGDEGAYGEEVSEHGAEIRDRICNEWTLTTEIAKWIGEILEDHPELPFGTAKAEESGTGSRKRRDLTIYNRDGKKVLTGELKMPDSPEGSSPYRESLVLDAHNKANSSGVDYFFTWNVNRCVLWQTYETGKSITERKKQHFDVLTAPVRTAEEVGHPRVEDQIKKFLESFLVRFAAIMQRSRGSTHGAARSRISSVSGRPLSISRWPLLCAHWQTAMVPTSPSR